MAVSVWMESTGILVIVPQDLQEQIVEPVSVVENVQTNCNRAMVFGMNLLRDWTLLSNHLAIVGSSYVSVWGVHLCQQAF